MKTVSDILWSDLFDDCTDIAIFDFWGVKITSNYYTTHRYYEDVEQLRQFEVYSFKYFPGNNILHIFLNCPKEVIDNDPT